MQITMDILTSRSQTVKSAIHFNQVTLTHLHEGSDIVLIVEFVQFIMLLHYVFVVVF